MQIARYTGGSCLSQTFWKHENLSSLSVLKFTLNYTKTKLYIFGKKIWANQESGLTTVWLKWDPPVPSYAKHIKLVTNEAIILLLFLLSFGKFGNIKDISFVNISCTVQL